MSQFKISTRLAAMIGLLCLLLLAIGLLGLRGIAGSNAALESVYADRTVALAQLSEVMRFDLRNQIALASAVADPRTPSTASYLAEIEANNAALQKNWKDYAATTLTDPEQLLVKSYLAHFAAQDSHALAPLQAALKAGDYKEAQRLLAAVVPQASQAVRADIDALVKLQVDEARRVYDHEVQSYQTLWQGMAIGIALAIALAALGGFLLIRAITAALHQAQKLAEAVAEGDLRQAIQPLGQDEVARLLQALGNMRLALVGVVGQVRQGAEAVAQASAEIAQGNHDLSSRTENQASALQQTAAAMEQLGSTFNQNADSARQAKQLAESASTVALRGGEVVGQVVETMKDINDSSRRIGDIISVIDGIAFQTNILALNAAVEAARAGEQGRGFAVVASEVRALAGRSAEAAKEIKGLIGSSVARVEQGSALVDQAGVTMQEVVQAIRRVSDVVAEISAAGAEQASGVSQVGAAVQQLDQVTQQNAALVEQMAAASSSLNSQASELVAVVAPFQLEAHAAGALHSAATTRPLRTVAKTAAAKVVQAAPQARLAQAKAPAAVASKPAATSAARLPAKAGAIQGEDDNWESF